MRFEDLANVPLFDPEGTLSPRNLEREWIKDELASLWDDLFKELRYAKSEGLARPSVGMVNIIERMRRAALLVGATPWQNIRITNLCDGSYEHLAKIVGLEYSFPTPEEWDDFVTTMSPTYDDVPYPGSKRP